MSYDITRSLDLTKFESSHLDFAQIDTARLDRKKAIEFEPELVGAIAGTMVAKTQNNNVVALREPNIGAVMPSNVIKVTLQNLENGSMQAKQAKTEDIKNANSSEKLKNFNTDAKSLISVILTQAFQRLEDSGRHNQAEWVKVKGEMNQKSADFMRTVGAEALKGAVFQAMAGVGISAGGFKMQQNGLNRERGVLKNDHLDLANKNNALNIAQNNSAKVGAPSLVRAQQPTAMTQLQTQDGRTINLQSNNQTIDPRHKAQLDDAAQTKLKHEISITENTIKDKQNKADSKKATGMLVSSLSHPTTGVVNGNTQFVQADANANQYLHQQAGETSQSIGDAQKESATKTANLMDEVLKQLQEMITNSYNTVQFLVSKSV